MENPRFVYVLHEFRSKKRDFHHHVCLPMCNFTLPSSTKEALSNEWYATNCWYATILGHHMRGWCHEVRYSIWRHHAREIQQMTRDLLPSGCNSGVGSQDERKRHQDWIAELLLWIQLQLFLHLRVSCAAQCSVPSASYINIPHRYNLVYIPLPVVPKSYLGI